MAGVERRAGGPALGRRLGVLTGVVLLGLAPGCTHRRDPAPDRPPAHVELTREEDLARTRALLGAAGLFSGAPAATGLERLEREVYGRTPEGALKVAWEKSGEIRETIAGVPVVTHELVGRVDNSAYPTLTVNIIALVAMPAAAPGPAPVILSFSPVGSPSPALAVPWPADPEPTTVCRPRAILPRLTTSLSDRPPGPPGPVDAEALARGWGYAWINIVSIQADNAEGLTCGAIGLANRGQPRSLDDWGAVAAWAWGASRLMDFLETYGAVDARRVAVSGSSRWAEAALLAAARDPRFALVHADAPADGDYHRRAGAALTYAATPDAISANLQDLARLIAPRPVSLVAGPGGPAPQSVHDFAARHWRN